MVVTDEFEARVVASAATRLFVAGEWRDAAGGRTFAVEDPATGAVFADVADGTAADATAAVDACCAVAGEWAAWAPRARGELLARAHSLVADRRDELALLLTLETGKPLAESHAELAYGGDFLRWFAEEAVRIEGRYGIVPGGRGRMFTMKTPVGPCYAITPWNFPVAMAARKIAPALAAGCTIVVKPAEQTPLTTLALARALEDAGLPAGVLDVVTTSSPAEVSRTIIGDPRLRKLSFTGSTAVGRELVRQSARGLLRLSLELGGNAPFLVFSDADVDAAVDGAVLAKMRNGGQACTAANRFYVASGLVDEFAAGLAARLAAMEVGRGTRPEVSVGPLIDGAHRARVARLVRDAVGSGAEIVVGGHALDGPGHFYAPTVVTGVGQGAALLTDEIFGPVAPVVAFEDEDAGIAAANATSHGLAAYVYTRDVSRAWQAIERLDVGMVGLNQGLVSDAAAPFGGVKASGFGREGGREGIEEYLSLKYVALAP